MAPDSDTETFVALRALVDNWRWEGVPFFLRSGKRLAETHHLLTVAFSEPPRRMFPLDCSQVAEGFGHDHLTFELGDPGSISATFLAKVPGPKMQLGQAHMRFSYADSFGGPECGARRLRAPDPRRDGRRPHAVHHIRRRSSASGKWRTRSCANRRRPRSTSRAPGGRRRPRPWSRPTAGTRREITPECWPAASSESCARVLPGVVHRQAPLLRALEEVAADDSVAYFGVHELAGDQLPTLDGHRVQDVDWIGGFAGG